ncbi:MAG: XdhC family protein [Rhodobacteraceae bacterium]|nr:XdhC family protein [Paracoccaceae bacterium]
MDSATLARLNAARRARKPVISVTPLDDTGSAELHFDDTITPTGPLAAALGAALASGKAQTVTVAKKGYFLNPYLPAPRLVIIGAVHISQHLAPMAQAVGFDVTIIDPRTAFASPERFADQRLIADWPQEALGAGGLDRWSALAALSHDPKIDDWPLIAALRAGCFYVGALGSRKTHARRVERLQMAGLSADQIARIHAPIGLPIGAANPAEIAVATLAQIIGQLRQGNR